MAETTTHTFGSGVTISERRDQEVGLNRITNCPRNRERYIIAHRVIRIERTQGAAVTQSSVLGAQSSVLSPQSLLILRGDALASCDTPITPEQVIGKVIAVERAGRRIDLANRRAKLKRTCRVWASRLVHRLNREKGPGVLS